MLQIPLPNQIFSSPTITLYKPKIIQFTSEEDLKIGIVNSLIENTIETSFEYGTSRLALSNGKILNEIYKILAKNNQFPPENTEIYATHEIHPSGKVKNDITKNLGQTKLDEARYTQFVNTKISSQDSLALYNEVLDQFEEDEGFDVCLIELNKNGNFAGLISGGTGLEGYSDVVVLNEFKNEKIISISAQTILKSKLIFIALNDEDETLEELLDGTKSVKEFPAKVLLAHPNVHIFYHLAA